MPRAVLWEERGNRVRDASGQATVELALVVPIMALLVMGIVQLGLIFRSQLALDGAVRDGARIGATGADDAQIVDRVVAAGGLDRAALTVDIAPVTPRRSGDIISVTGRYRVDLFVPLISNLLGSSLELSASASMRVE